MSGDRDRTELSRLYRETRHRLTALAGELEPAALDAPAPACPGWSARDVLAHLAANAEDGPAGRLKGIPSDEHTAAQVARFADHGVPDVLAAWEAAAGAFEELMDARGIWPALIDAVSHEHDIRAAVGRPGARDSEAVRQVATVVLASLDPPVPLRVTVEDRDFRLGPENGPEVGLSTTRFEVLRWRMGRRSRAQLAAMAWTGDPTPVLDSLAVFGPAATDIIE